MQAQRSISYWSFSSYLKVKSRMNVKNNMIVKVLILLSFLNLNFSAELEPLNVPDIFLIGAGKCGSTTLHEILVEHPEICRSEVKEFHYFSEERNLKKGRKWYTDQFKGSNNCTGAKYLIDGTPR